MLLHFYTLISICFLFLFVFSLSSFVNTYVCIVYYGYKCEMILSYIASFLRFLYKNSGNSRSCDPCARGIQLQLITFAMTFAETSAGSFLARAINFHFAFLSGMGGHFRQRVAFLREMGIDLKNAAAKVQLATRPLPVCP